ncbi:hypothetical protein REPUB_Repub20aG0102500 [Reevesia pubescens]
MSFKALDDHIEIKLVLLLLVDHPIVSSFDSVLNEAKPLVMDTGLLVASLLGGLSVMTVTFSNQPLTWYSLAKIFGWIGGPKDLKMVVVEAYGNYVQPFEVNDLFPVFVFSLQFISIMFMLSLY